MEWQTEREQLVAMMEEMLQAKAYSKIREYVADHNLIDIAFLMDDLSEENILKVYRILSKDTAAELFAYLEVETQQLIVRSMSDVDAANLIDNLMADDAVDFLEEVPANVVKRLLANAKPETRKAINQLLKYPEGCAGSLMTVEYVALKERMNVAQSIARIRQIAPDAETINVCYVLDAQRKLTGYVTLARLLLSDDTTAIADLQNENVISATTMMDQREVAALFKHYDLIALPVVDNENRLVGIITVDDIVDVIEEETTEEIEMMAAIMPGDSDKPYMKLGVFSIYKKRIPWLLLLMILAALTGAIISSFEESLSACAALIAFIPMLMNTGGNAGGQASVTVIRGLSLDEITYKDVPGVLWKELRVSILCGLSLSIVSFGKLLWFDQVGVAVSATVCMTLFVCVVAAMIVGCILPILAKRLKLDPAVMASPFITTIVDALSLLVYFRFATLILGL